MSKILDSTLTPREDVQNLLQEASVSYRELSAWVMGMLMAGAGLFYLKLTLDAGGATGWEAPPVAVFIPYVGLLIVASIIAQTTLAALKPREADAPADERERPLLDRAGNWSGYVLGAGAVGSLIHFLAHGDGDLLFHMLMGSLIVAQTAEYAFQVLLFRRGA
jgi:hypothetical protein